LAINHILLVLVLLAVEMETIQEMVLLQLQTQVLAVVLVDGSQSQGLLVVRAALES
jgi:hypothetical protein